MSKESSRARRWGRIALTLVLGGTLYLPREGSAEPDLAALAGSSNRVFERGRFLPGSRVYSFGSAVNLRQNPSRSAAVVAVVNLGQALFLVERVDESLDSVNGLVDSWYRVHLETNSKLPGCIWGGLIARAALACDIDRDGKPELILTGFPSRDRNRGVNLLETRIVRDGKLLAKWSGDPPLMNPGSEVRLSLEAALLDSSGFRPEPVLWRLGFERHGEQAATADLILAWYKGAVQTAWVLLSSNGAGGPRFILPSDLGGVSNAILERATVDARGGSNQRRATWDGNAFR